jgi:hypothetical protein
MIFVYSLVPQKMRSINMHHIKSVKMYFCFAVLLFVAKPFLGFTMFNSVPHSDHSNIYVKSFTKRKQEYAEDSNSNIESIQKRLADPVKALLLHFSFLLAVIFPAIFAESTAITNRFLNDLQLSLSPRRHSYLLNSNFLI